MAEETKQFCTFETGRLFIGVDVLSVQEVLRARELAPVPLAPHAIDGLLNLRGQIVTAIDLRLRLELPPRPSDLTPVYIVVRTHDGVIALIVDSIGDVIEVTAASHEPPPDTLIGPARELLPGVHKLEKRLLHVLDVERAVNLTPSA